jgi:hypothetical protein
MGEDINAGRTPMAKLPGRPGGLRDFICKVWLKGKRERKKLLPSGIQKIHGASSAERDVVQLHPPAVFMLKPEARAARQRPWSPVPAQT